jgi:hypothetical protein
MPIQTSRGIELELLGLECLRSNERRDEIYCYLEGYYLDKSSKIYNRVPHNTYWAFQKGDYKALKATLFLGPLHTGFTLSIVLMEQEAHGLIYSLRMLNECIGKVTLRIMGSGEIRMTPEENAILYHQSGQENYSFDLTGAGAHYRMWLSLKFLEE